MTQEKYDAEQEYWATMEGYSPHDKGKWFDDGLTQAFAYAKSDKIVKIAREGVAVDAYLEGFLDGIAYFITEMKGK